MLVNANAHISHVFMFLPEQTGVSITDSYYDGNYENIVYLGNGYYAFKHYLNPEVTADTLDQGYVSVHKYDPVLKKFGPAEGGQIWSTYPHAETTGQYVAPYPTYVPSAAYGSFSTRNRSDYTNHNIYLSRKDGLYVTRWDANYSTFTQVNTAWNESGNATSGYDFYAERSTVAVSASGTKVVLTGYVFNNSRRWSAIFDLNPTTGVLTRRRFDYSTGSFKLYQTGVFLPGSDKYWVGVAVYGVSGQCAIYDVSANMFTLVTNLGFVDNSNERYAMRAWTYNGKTYIGKINSSARTYMDVWEINPTTGGVLSTFTTPAITYEGSSTYDSGNSTYNIDAITRQPCTDIGESVFLVFSFVNNSERGDWLMYAKYIRMTDTGFEELTEFRFDFPYALQEAMSRDELPRGIDPLDYFDFDWTDGIQPINLNNIVVSAYWTPSIGGFNTVAGNFVVTSGATYSKDYFWTNLSIAKQGAI